MPSFADFAALKARLTVKETISFLGLSLKHRNGQWRGPTSGTITENLVFSTRKIISKILPTPIGSGLVNLVVTFFRAVC